MEEKIKILITSYEKSRTTNLAYYNKSENDINRAMYKVAIIVIENTINNLLKLIDEEKRYDI